MKFYLKSKKTTPIFSKKGEIIDNVEVSLFITGRSYDDVTKKLHVHHSYEEKGSNGEIEKINSNKSISYDECNQLALLVNPSLPNGLGDMERQQMKVLMAAKQFFADSYKNLTVADIEIIEELEEN